MRTLKELATEALQVQDACNLSGVLHAWSRSITELRVLLEGQTGFSTDKLNRHPISVVWADKVASLTGTQNDTKSVFDAFGWCHDLIEGRTVRCA